MQLNQASNASLSIPEKESAFADSDYFADNRVLLVITNEASLKFHDYTDEDFSEISCKRVIDLTASVGDEVEKKVKVLDDSLKSNRKSETLKTEELIDVSISDYRQVLCLELQDAGKDNVLSAIEILQWRDDVLYAQPDYAISICSTTPNDAGFTGQWGLDKIQIEDAWDITTGSSAVKVGVVDSGIDGSHRICKIG